MKFKVHVKYDFLMLKLSSTNMQTKSKILSETFDRIEKRKTKVIVSKHTKTRLPPCKMFYQMFNEEEEN